MEFLRMALRTNSWCLVNHFSPLPFVVIFTAFFSPSHLSLPIFQVSFGNVQTMCPKEGRPQNTFYKHWCFHGWRTCQASAKEETLALCNICLNFLRTADQPAGTWDWTFGVVLKTPTSSQPETTGVGVHFYWPSLHFLLFRPCIGTFQIGERKLQSFLFVCFLTLLSHKDRRGNGWCWPWWRSVNGYSSAHPGASIYCSIFLFHSPLLLLLLPLSAVLP